ncbi:MAG: InlB B-repeat-containing protein [Chitinophagaceae bacterium]|nr:InlB B-repeat-containing protein [Chitinophagaceae bacterium]
MDNSTWAWNLRKTGFSFSGWNTESDGSGHSYSTGSTIIMESDSIVLYAQWSTPEINISGNSIPIVNGDISPETNDFTDFGSTNIGTSITQTFSIENTGSFELSLTNNPGLPLPEEVSPYWQMLRAQLRRVVQQAFRFLLLRTAAERSMD